MVTTLTTPPLAVTKALHDGGHLDSMTPAWRLLIYCAEGIAASLPYVVTDGHWEIIDPTTETMINGGLWVIANNGDVIAFAHHDGVGCIHCGQDIDDPDTPCIDGTMSHAGPHSGAMMEGTDGLGAWPV